MRGMKMSEEREDTSITTTQNEREEHKAMVLCQGDQMSSPQMSTRHPKTQDMKMKHVGHDKINSKNS